MSSDGVDKFIAMCESERAQRIEDLEAERDRYKAAYEAADKYIEENPCDPDIYPEQWAAWEKYLIAKQALEDKT